MKKWLIKVCSDFLAEVWTEAERKQKVEYEFSFKEAEYDSSITTRCRAPYPWEIVTITPQHSRTFDVLYRRKVK